MPEKETYYTTDFQGYWPVPVGAVAVAKDREQAIEMLRRAIVEAGLPSPTEDFEVIHLIEGAHVLSDGNY